MRPSRGSTTRPAGAPTTQPAGGTQVTFDRFSGNRMGIEAASDDIVVITGEEGDLAQLSALIEALDAQQGVRPIIEVVPLKSAQAQAIAPTIQQVWERAHTPPGRRLSPEDQVTIVPDARSNVLIVAASEENMPEVKQIIEGLDRLPIFGEVEMVTIELKNIKAKQAETTVRDVLSAFQKRRGVTGPDQFDVRAIEATNSLLIMAPSIDMELIRQLIEQVDVEPEFAKAKTIIYPLLQAHAQDLADSLNALIEVREQQDEGGVAIRRMQLTRRTIDGTSETLPELNLDKPIRIEAEIVTNSLIVSTHEENVPAFDKLIEWFDAMPRADEMMVRVFPLKHADADNVATMLRDMFQSGQQLPNMPDRPKPIRGAVPEGPAGGALVYNIDIASDPRTNMLVVAGRTEQILFIQELIKLVDVEGMSNQFPVRLIFLEHAAAERVSTLITDLFNQRLEGLRARGVKAVERERVFIRHDPRTNALIVSAKEEHFKEIESLAKELDRLPLDYVGDIRIINLENLTATDLGPQIEQLWEQRAAAKGLTTEERPVIIADTRSNSLVIAANREDFEAISRLVKDLEQQRFAPVAEIRLHILTNNDATKIGPMLVELFRQRAEIALQRGQEVRPSERVAISVDPAMNALLIAASPEIYEEITRLLSQLDAELPVEGVVRTFYLQNADATRAAEIIDQLFTKGIIRGAQPGSALQEDRRKVTVITDTRSNALIVSATPENFAIVETLVKQIDAKDAPVFTSDTRVLKVEHADVVRVADMLDQIFQGIRATLPSEEQSTMDMTVIPVARNNSLIISGSRYGLRRAEELLPMIDTEPGPPTAEIKVYSFKNASAKKLAPVMSDLFDQRQSADQSKGGTPIFIEADEDSNTLIVSASQDDHIIAQELVELLDVPSAIAQQMKIIPLAKARAEQLAETLSTLLEQQNRQRDVPFAITPEPRTNSLVVFAAPSDMVQIQMIVQQLDTNRPVRELSMRVFRLQKAKADDLAERIDEFLKGQGATTSGGGGGVTESEQDAIVINFTTVDQSGRRVERSLIRQDIFITPDLRTNSLLVMAPPESIEMMEVLVTMLDDIEPITAEIQIFALQNADATDMKDLLEELFQVGEQAPSGEQEQSRQLVFAGAGGAAGALTGTSDLTFAVDERTNSLIAAGSREYLRQVETLVTELDLLNIEDRLVRVVKLANGSAPDVATTLDGYFQAEAQVIESAVTGEESVLRKIEREVTIQADEDTNTLLVAYSPRMESQITEMIGKLDQAPPQVMIRLLIAEVTLDDRVEFGMEFALQDLLFTEKATTGANGTIQGDNFDTVFGTEVGAAGSGGLSGFSFTITGEDFNFLLRALQSDGRLEVLSRPSIMVADNQDANITVGDRVPTVQDVTITQGIVTPSVTYEDVGIILTVTPQINPDGFVTLEIAPEISAIGTSSITVAQGVTLPTFTERSAETVVTVRDGETIVIGGLITERDSDAENKVPVLGDIPILGNLLRATQRNQTKTELLFVLTPTVIRTPAEAFDMSVKERDQTGLLERVRESPLMGKLRMHPEENRLGPSDDGGSPETSGAGEPGEVYGPELETYGPASEAIEETGKTETEVTISTQ